MNVDMSSKVLLLTTLLGLLQGCWHKVEQNAKVSCKFSYQEDDYRKNICYQGIKIARLESERSLNFKSTEYDVIQAVSRAEMKCYKKVEAAACVFGVNMFKEHGIKNWEMKKYFR